MKRLALAVLLALPGACAVAAAPPAVAPATSADARFEAIHTREWAWRQEQLGIADEDGDGSGDRHRLPAVDPASQAARLRVWQDVLRQLDAIDPAQLSAGNRVNLAIYRAQVENLAADVRFRAYEMPFNSDSSFWSNLGFMTRRPLRSAEQYRAYIDRLADVPRYFDEHIANMRAGLARGFSVPRAVLDGRDASIAAVAQLKDPEQSKFFEPLKKMPASIPAEEQQRLREAARAAIRDRLIPAYARLLAFFREEYLPQARTTLAAEAMPDGAAYYRQQIREYTTLDLDPEQIHRIGLEEVARIQAEMDAIIRRVGFKGDFAAFLAFLRTDPQFYAATPQQLLERAAWIAKRVDGELGKFIGTLPRERFTIVPVPDDIAPFWTSGRGGAGTYWVNTYDLRSRPLYNLPALTLHEAAPGHALQGSLAKEHAAQPEFRRRSYISAYGEGWGLYSEKLGQEMGIYETPYEEFGRLTYEMWRACRLVIDTGIHHKGWSREQAQAYLRERTALSEHEVVTEVDRYISWPGQALSYKLGELAIVRLRREAEQALGPKFDLKAFHDVVLGQGSVPLPVLEQQVRDYIAKSAPAKAG
ncbi:uncharacterized protein (DUF885 family) [Vulcaniibacterium tengchongense]|uniref:Uncharacterized protein (DUF885 family) n=1 Tax=Vulcaniibacterium tengchongense TaxID=1273429 RepID=A0A3N4VDR5_9GAMM|nr:DUF885 family protein [Vulcaniibacterium tengchongense]RPE79933.1 uncharacterized protein (DUF885 family) [Vulcaniibacterium tengchongense]